MLQLELNWERTEEHEELDFGTEIHHSKIPKVSERGQGHTLNGRVMAH